MLTSLKKSCILFMGYVFENNVNTFEKQMNLI
jgi:hypothetical protein